jgi:hypothetical protein
VTNRGLFWSIGQTIFGSWWMIVHSNIYRQQSRAKHTYSQFDAASADRRLSNGSWPMRYSTAHISEMLLLQDFSTPFNCRVEHGNESNSSSTWTRPDHKIANHSQSWWH